MVNSFFDNCYLANRFWKHEMNGFVGITDNEDL